MKRSTHIALLLILSVCKYATAQADAVKEDRRPNILFAISDDQSFFHSSFAGSPFVNTPGFDRIAREGVYFTNCYAGSPGCAPSRSALITGRHHWQNEQSGQHASSWMKKYVPF
ncbi:sulfatase-like hydrolase/transferase, partial [Pricia sp.]|uniref:sulfatase-like hydrolase/transferase n=1 Tax=Pricia sp. TaxID=2268138 RepID=UPI003593153A